MKTIVVIMVILVALVTVSPAYADGGAVKPVCTEKDGFLARLFGKCVVLDSNQNTATQQGDTVGETMTESNPVHENTEKGLCAFNDGSDSNWDNLCNKSK